MASNSGSRAFAGSPIATFSCSDVWGNSGGDWVSEIADQAGQNGNLCLDPLFCNASVGDFNLREDSPCRGHAPESPNCDLMGAWPVGCETSGLAWGSTGSGGDAGIRIAPNPARGACVLGYSAAIGEPVRVEVFDAAGRYVRRLEDRSTLAGARSVSWDGSDEAGRPVSAGIYLVRVVGPSSLRTGRVVLTR